MDRKKCLKCGGIKPTIDFYTNPEYRDGFRSHCKQCTNRATARWHRSHKEVVNRIMQKYRQTHPETERAARARYRKRHPEIKRKHNRIREARKAGVEESFSVEDEKFVYDRWEHKCVVCDRTALETILTIDHWMPLSKGFALTRSNAVLMCLSCNSKKKAKMPHEVYEADFVRWIEARLEWRAEIETGKFKE